MQALELFRLVWVGFDVEHMQTRRSPSLFHSEAVPNFRDSLPKPRCSVMDPRTPLRLPATPLLDESIA